MTPDLKASMPAPARPALVTGASRGLGRAIALALAALGCPVIVNYRHDDSAARSVVDAIAAGGGRAVPVRADVSLEAEVAVLVARAREAFGPPGIVVNNAGVAARLGVGEITAADFDHVIVQNLRSAFLVTQAVLPGMIAQRWGRLLFMSSTAARIGGIVSAGYAASKAGMEGLMHYYATHLAAHGVTANAIAPALFDTDMVGTLPLPDAAALPLGRLGRPEEIGAVAQMLVACEYMTGQTVQVNAGRYHT